MGRLVRRGNAFRKSRRLGRKAPRQLRLSEKELEELQRVFVEGRSRRSIEQDLRRKAKIAPTVQAWVKHPNKYDLPGIDLPNTGDVIAVVGVEDRPVAVVRGRKKPEEAKRQVEEAVKKADKRARRKAKARRGRRLPTKSEIEEKAVELYMKEHPDMPLTPEVEELKEGGYYERARRELMRAERSVEEEQKGLYIQGMLEELRRLLEPEGLTVEVIPLED